MYQPPLHREDRLEVQHALIETHPFGLLISNGPSDLLANGLPFILKRDHGPFGLLKAHIARANNQWQDLDGQRVLVVDKREAGGYITPIECVGEYATYVSRIRQDSTIDNGISLWCVSDNLRKGAALNAVQIAETLLP